MGATLIFIFLNSLRSGSYKWSSGSHVAATSGIEIRSGLTSCATVASTRGSFEVLASSVRKLLLLKLYKLLLKLLSCSAKLLMPRPARSSAAPLRQKGSTSSKRFLENCRWIAGEVAATLDMADSTLALLCGVPDSQYEKST